MAEWIDRNAAGRPYAIRLNGSRNAWLLARLGLNRFAIDAPPHGHLLFISKNVRCIDRTLTWLQNHHPIAQIGDSIDVYDLTGPPTPDEPDDMPMHDPTAGW